MVAQKTAAGRALVVVDVQRGFVSDYTRRCLPTIDRLLDARFDVKIATRFRNPEGSQFRSLIQWDRLSSPREIELIEGIEERVDAVVDKETYGCGDELDALLTEAGIGEVVIVGIDTDVCVLQNAAQLFDKGYVVVVDVDGCATNGGPEADHAARGVLRRTIGRNQVGAGLVEAGDFAAKIGFHSV